MTLLPGLPRGRESPVPVRGGLPGRGNGLEYHAREATVPADERRGPTVGRGSVASLPSLRFLRNSRPASLLGLHTGLVSSRQLLEQHEVIPP
jgi:hypothetical protein